MRHTGMYGECRTVTFAWFIPSTLARDGLHCRGATCKTMFVLRWTKTRKGDEDVFHARGGARADTPPALRVTCAS